MAAMKLRLVLCFFLGLCSAATAERQYEVRLDAKSTYPHAGRVDVFVNGSWATICAPDWDISDGEVICRDLGLGFVNTITVSGGVNQASPSPSKCLRSVTCYGHEERLSDCIGHEFGIRSDGNDKGVVCYPPPSDAGVRLRYGPDQYSGRVEVKLASGSWDELWAYDAGGNWYYQYVDNICRQLGFGELNWWDRFEFSSSRSMTAVYNCAYGVADHRSCTLSTLSVNHQAVVGCHKPGSIPCSAPYIPDYATISHPRLNYNYGDKVTVTCDTNNATFTLQCHNKGLWSGPVVSCPKPIPHTFPTLRGFYDCNTPFVPPGSRIENFRYTYKPGDTVNVTCNSGPGSFLLECQNRMWNGPMIECPQPVIECNQPFIPAGSSVVNLKARYKISDEVNVTCNNGSDWFIWECQKDGLWRGRAIYCLISSTEPPVSTVKPKNGVGGREFIINGLLVAAVTLFIFVLMSMMALFIYVRKRIDGSDISVSSKGRKHRGPLPDIPDGYANYIADEQSLYVEPYTKPS